MWNVQTCGTGLPPTVSNVTDILSPVRELKNAVEKQKKEKQKPCCWGFVVLKVFGSFVFAVLSYSALRLILSLPECMFLRVEWLITPIWSPMWSILTSTLTKSTDSSAVLLGCAAFLPAQIVWTSLLGDTQRPANTTFLNQKIERGDAVYRKSARKKVRCFFFFEGGTGTRRRWWFGGGLCQNLPPSLVWHFFGMTGRRERQNERKR